MESGSYQVDKAADGGEGGGRSFPKKERAIVKKSGTTQKRKNQIREKGFATSFGPSLHPIKKEMTGRGRKKKYRKVSPAPAKIIGAEGQMVCGSRKERTIHLSYKTGRQRGGD